MAEYGKPVIIIPAYNEEKYLGKTIKLIKKTGLDIDIVVVNDGSTDRTSEVARKMGCAVVELKENRGKANAFYAGLKAGLERNAPAVVTLDADMITVPRDDLAELISVARKATEARKINMVIGVQAERIMKRVPLYGSELTFSGMRAYSIPAIHKIRQSKFKSLAKDFGGMELFLRDFFKHEEITRLRNTEFKTHKPHRTEESGKRQKKDIESYLRRSFKLRSKFRRK